MDSLNQNFLPFEIDQIIRIPLNNPTHEDELIWAYNNNGSYIVKFGYHAICQWSEQETDNSGSSIIIQDTIQNKLWKQNIPPKQANLFWRILHSGMPVKSNLMKRGIWLEPLCPRCGKEVETITHLFMQCEWAQRTWFASPLTVQFHHMQHGNFIEWLKHQIRHENQYSMEMISTLIYGIWNDRNNLVFQNRDLPISEVINKSMKALTDY